MKIWFHCTSISVENSLSFEFADFPQSLGKNRKCDFFPSILTLISALFNMLRYPWIMPIREMETSCRSRDIQSLAKYGDIGRIVTRKSTTACTLSKPSIFGYQNCRSKSCISESHVSIFDWVGLDLNNLVYRIRSSMDDSAKYSHSFFNCSYGSRVWLGKCHFSKQPRTWSYRTFPNTNSCRKRYPWS